MFYNFSVSENFDFLIPAQYLLIIKVFGILCLPCESLNFTRSIANFGDSSNENISVIWY